MTLDDICKKFGNDMDYLNKLKYYIFNLENIIQGKKVRNSQKRKKLNFAIIIPKDN